jgi:hypothetical protein
MIGEIDFCNFPRPESILNPKEVGINWYQKYWRNIYPLPVLYLGESIEMPQPWPPSEDVGCRAMSIWPMQ